MKKKYVIGLIIVIALAVVAIAGYFIYEHNSKPYNMDLSKYVKVGKYTGLKYDQVTPEVTSEEVEQQVNANLEKAATTEDVKEGTVADGDTINIAYTGKVDGKTFEGGSTDSQDITIGTTPFIDGFTEGLIGKKIGDKVTLNLKFPEDYQEKSLAGKDVVFDVTINSKKVKKVPELNEKFVKSATDDKCKTVDEYKDYVKKQLIDSKKSSYDNYAKQQLWAQVIKDSKAIKHPKKELKDAEKQADEMEEQYKAQASAQGMDWATFLKNNMGTDEKGFKKQKEEYAKNIVFQQMVVYYIADKENIKVTKKEYDKNLEEALKGSGLTKKKFKEAYNMSIEKYAEQNNWKEQMLMGKVLDYIMEKGKPTKVTEAEFQKNYASQAAQSN